MSRATLVYILMLAACAGGMWLIIRLGAGMTAPTDLSGVWHVGGEDPALPRVLGDIVHVEQSGRYVRLNFERGLQVDVKLVAESRPDPAKADGLDLRFQGPVWSLAAMGANAAGPLIFRLDGPEPHTFTATRQRPDEADEGGEGGRAGVGDPGEKTANAGAHAP